MAAFDFVGVCSQLELSKHDPAVDAPERDHHVDAPEPCLILDAPQVY